MLTINLNQTADKNIKPATHQPMQSKQDWINQFISFGWREEEIPTTDAEIKEFERSFGQNDHTHAGLIYYMHYCWANELGAQLRPDMIWHAIVSEIAAQVLESPDKYRFLFTDGPDKKEIITLTDDETQIHLDRLMAGMKSVIKNKEFISLICGTKFESAVEGADYAIMRTMAHMGTPFFDYMTTRCGIPHLELVNSKADWIKLHSAIKSFGQFGLEKSNNQFTTWLDTCAKIISNILFWGFGHPVVECRGREKIAISRQPSAVSRQPLAIEPPQRVDDTLRRAWNRRKMMK